MHRLVSTCDEIGLKIIRHTFLRSIFWSFQLWIVHLQSLKYSLEFHTSTLIMGCIEMKQYTWMTHQPLNDAHCILYIAMKRFVSVYGTNALRSKKYQPSEYEASFDYSVAYNMLTEMRPLCA